MIYNPQTPWYSYWTHLRYWWGQPCDVSTIDLQQQSIQGDVSEETNTVKIWGRIGGYLHHTSIVRNMSKKQVSSVESMEDMILWIFTRLEKIQKSKWREVYLLSPFILLDFFQIGKNPGIWVKSEYHQLNQWKTWYYGFLRDWKKSRFYGLLTA